MPDGDSAFLATPARMVPTNSTIPPTMSEAAQSGITRASTYAAAISTMISPA